MKFIDDKSRARTESLTGPLDDGFLHTVDFFVARSAGIFIPTVEHCGYASFPSHSHPAWNFIVHLNERQVLENFETKWEGEGFTVTAIPPLVVHTDKPHELNTRYASIFVSGDFLASEAALYPGEPIPAEKPFSFSVDNDVLNYVKEFIAEYESDLPGYDRLLDSISLKIAHLLIRGIKNIKSRWSNITERMEINKTCDFIHQFYWKKLKVSDLAEIAAISESHFAHVFKKETGFSPLDYVNRIRIDKAKKLLNAGNNSMTEIALQVGFSSSSHFSSTFVKFAGASPTEFIKKKAES